MLDMSWGEIMVIGGVALIVIGPKDLPRALRTVGQMTAKVRRMAGEFQSQFSEAMREAELEDVKREVAGLNRSVASATSAAFNPIQTIRDELKNSVDGRPIATSPASSGTVPFGSNPGEAPVVEEVGPIPQIEPAGTTGEPGADVAPLPDAVPLIPIPAPPEPPSLPTPPGLETSSTEPARLRDAAP